LFFYGEQALETQREQFFDSLTQWVPAPQSAEIVVIDVDRKSMQQLPDKTWGRTETADLLSRLSKAGARAVAVDFIFSTACDPVEPSNVALTQAISSVPVVLGFLIADGGPEHPAPVPPVAVRTRRRLLSWSVTRMPVSAGSRLSRSSAMTPIRRWGWKPPVWPPAAARRFWADNPPG
jgi:adenylate cyclase